MANSTNPIQHAFIPRSVLRKETETSKKKKSHESIVTHIKGKTHRSSSELLSSVYQTEETVKVNKVENPGTCEEVKKYSSQQRWPGADEPVCVICDKYGEYICNETDEDVCSIECKTKHLNGVKLQPQYTPPSTSSAEGLDTVNVPEICFDSFYAEKVLWHPSEELSLPTHFALKERLEIRTRGKNVPKLISTFAQCEFPPQLLDNLSEHGFTDPTPVQMQVIPAMLQGNDVLVSACTSSGKTAGFLLPILHQIHSCVALLPSNHLFCETPLAMIITPTRELAEQIERVAKEFSKGLCNLRTALLIGGAPLPPQLHRLKRNIQLGIGTPGRINDILSKHHALDLNRVKTVVLDEVDVMLQMGFRNQITTIVEAISSKPQYAMISATIPSAIEDLASSMMDSPILISVGSQGLPNKLLKQIVIWVEDASKRKKLFSILNESKYFSPPALVFVNSKIGADMLANAISEKLRVKCESLHSDKSQSERSEILSNLSNGIYDVVVCTSVIARGIDLVNVNQVIVFDMPNTIEEYIHQIGRAGGLSSQGFVMSFINKSDKNIFLDFKDLCEASGVKVPEELINSSYLLSEKVKREKGKGKETFKNSISKRWSDEKVTSLSLLQILTKNRRR